MDNDLTETSAGRRALIGGVAAAGLAFATPALADTTAPTPGSELMPFDVLRFSAKRDGRTDDTAAAQAAIDAALAAGGGRVHFPSGRYRITRSLRFASQARADVTGDGQTSVLLHENDEPLLVWPEGISCRDVSVRNLRVESVTHDKSQGTPVIACLGGVERSVFQHLFFVAGGARVGSGIVTEKVADTTVLESCVMWGVSGCGLRVAQGAEVRVLGGRIIGDGSMKPGNDGVLLTGNNGGVHIVTTDLIAFHTSMRIGIVGAPSNREIFITHATLDSSLHGLVIVDNSYTSIAGCWAASADDEQILLDSTAHAAILVVVGGTIFNGGAYGRPGTHNGIVVRAGHFTLSGVQIRNNKGTGVLVEGDAVSEYAITGCSIHDNGDAGAHLRGDNYAVTGNLFSRNGANLRDDGGRNKQVMGNVMTEKA